MVYLVASSTMGLIMRRFLHILNNHLLPKLFFVSAVMLVLPGCVNRMFYHPNRIEYRTKEQMGERTRDVFFTSGDGTKLHGWFVPAQRDPILGTVVHFHGNAQNLTAHSSFVDWLPTAGFHLFLFDYRGYGRSEGRPSREGLILDGEAALREVRRQPEVDTNRIVIIGQSLGGTTALGVASLFPELRGQALVIDSAFFSYRQIVRDKIKLIPLLSLLRVPLSYILISNAYSPGETLVELPPVPVLYLHGTADLVIPYAHSEMLYAATAEPKELLLVPGGTHISGMVDPAGDGRARVLDFIRHALDPAP